MYSQTNLSQQIQHVEQVVHQLINQTQQASAVYQQLLQQELQNAQQLEQMARREQQAAQIIQNALHGHEVAIQQMQQVTLLCKQLEQRVQIEQTPYLLAQQNAAAFAPQAAFQQQQQHAYQ
ncbi:putative ribosome quality control (RQC) complex YloA/Tae2 family protein [Paenibacillus phyllosphaerae]|uniref:Putative ribosome quality control (RQC) complex YloA/Tae2 family protein n=1 Tax=Paenibacillus phyllosphaerae TaxID=274593 RepID=A0A7W5FML9_9BACL|nr:hypothetical protein [Paenibacillus phyllosphaerae]MBB3110411.1 putative ribosome quality control (RQC) complex YloA/Tae2 family protein [Paenibacillus phyllosphaerae]